MEVLGDYFYSVYLNELYRWNEKTNLTAVKRERAVELLIKPSLAMAELISERDAEIVDIGSGAGFPAVILAAAMPEKKFRLIESNKKKCAFLERVAGLLDLKNVTVMAERADKVAKGGLRSVADIVTARAVKGEVVFNAASDLLKSGGKVLIHRSQAVRPSDGRFDAVDGNEFVECFKLK